MTKRWFFAAIAVCFSLMPTLALAHPELGNAYDFAHGLAHPLGGFNHFVTMVAVGMLAARLGGRALWLVPAAFVTTMAAAAIVGAMGMPIPYVEAGVALSVLVLGAAIAFDIAMPTAFAVALVGFFAIFHGHVHGAEIPATAAGIAYGLGFILACAALHGVGIGAGTLLAGTALGRRAVQVAGSATALAGAVLLAGAG